MRKGKFQVLLSIVICLGLILTGCTSNKTNNNVAVTENNTPAKNAKVVKIVFPHYQVGNHVGADYLKYTVTAFNEKFKGKYEISIEEVAGDQQYIDKLKVLSAANNLPPIFELGKDTSLGETIIKNDQVLDLKPYLDAAPELKSVFFDSSVAFNTKDGKIVGLPLSRDAYIGVFYNKELFAKAGIEKFPDTWDEFWVACEKLKKSGVAPLSLTTAEQGTMTNYFVTSMIGGSSAEGLKFMRTKYPTDFEAPYVVDAFKNIPKLFSYSTKDAVGGTYAIAANNFTSGKTAMIGNGPWMVDTFKNPSTAPAGFLDKVGVAFYPGHVLFSNEGKVYGWAIAKNQPKEVQEGAIEYLKFISTPEIIRKDMVEFGRFSTKVKLTEEDKAKLSKPVVELANLVENVKTVIPRILWDTLVQNDAILKQMPLLALNNITAEEYAKSLKAAALKYAETHKQ